MRTLALALVRLVPWLTRYFVVSNIPVDGIGPGLATLIRKKGGDYSYLYLRGPAGMGDEPVPDTEFFWGPWHRIDMLKGAGRVREVDELEAFVLIRRAGAR